MMHYGVVLSTRYTLKQKNLFFKDLKEQVKVKDLKIALQCSENKNGSMVNNIVVGDLRKAKTIIAAAYDTPMKTYIPHYTYFPLNTKKNLYNEYLNIVIQFLSSSLLFLIVYFLIRNYGDYNGFIKFGLALISIVVVVISYLILKGQSNKVNFNRNSASVALLVSLIKQAAKQNNIAYVFLDNAVASYNGLKLLNDHIQEDVEIILLDCLSDGESLILAHGEKNVVSANLLCKGNLLNIYNKTYTNDGLKNNLLVINQQIMYLVSGKVKNKQLVVKNTRTKQDYAYDNDRLVAIRDLLIAYIEGRNYDS